MKMTKNSQSPSFMNPAIEAKARHMEVTELVSNCCSCGGPEGYEESGICYACKEHCEYIEISDEED